MKKKCENIVPQLRLKICLLLVGRGARCSQHCILMSKILDLNKLKKGTACDPAAGAVCIVIIWKAKE